MSLTEQRLPKKILLASGIGCLIEFYDFGLYGSLAFAFAPQFFPSDQPFFSMLGAYVVFAVGFFARPIGSLIFGHMGDKKGRRVALFWSLMLMSISTLSIGLLPTYQSMGLFAPILMVLCRLTQGLSAGGEYSGALIFAIEHGAKKNRGLIGGLISAGCMSGLLLSTFASYVCALPQSPTWSWRVPFLIGFLISLVGIYVRFRLEETPLFIAQKEKNLSQLKFLEGIKSNFKSLFSVILLAGYNGIAIYVYSVFLSSYIAKESGLPESTIKVLHCLGTVVLIFMLIFFSYLSDRLDRPKLILKGAVFMAIASSLMFYYLPDLSLSGVIAFQLAFVIALGMYSGPINTFLVEAFQVGIRYRFASLGYSLGMGVIGGTGPLIASLLSANEHRNILLAGYFMIGGVLATLVLRRMMSKPSFEFLSQSVEVGV